MLTIWTAFGEEIGESKAIEFGMRQSWLELRPILDGCLTSHGVLDPPELLFFIGGKYKTDQGWRSYKRHKNHIKIYIQIPYVMYVCVTHRHTAQYRVHAQQMKITINISNTTPLMMKSILIKSAYNYTNYTIYHEVDTWRKQSFRTF